MTNFEPGNVVCLRSGGPAMTVRKQIGTTVITVWFIEDDVVEHSFPSKALVSLDNILADKAFGPIQHGHLTLVSDKDPA